MAGLEIGSTRPKPSTAGDHTSTKTSHTSRHTANQASSSSNAFPKTTKTTTVNGAPVQASQSFAPSGMGVPTVTPHASKTASAGLPVSTSLQASQMTPSSGQPVQPAGLSHGSKLAVIIASSIGGTFILLLLIYIIWRRRRGTTYSELVCFRRHSDTITLSPTEDGGRITALPIYQETRYSVRSSRFGSTLSLNKATRKRPSGVPSQVAEKFHKENPWMKTMWKTANPPTPTGENHPLTQVASAPPSPRLKQPEMVRVYSSQTAAKSRMSQNASGDTTKTAKSGLAVTVEEASPLQPGFLLPETPKSPTDEQDHRWSWTNSQAPPTPRLTAPSRRSSLSSLPKFKRVTSWVRGQANRQGIRLVEEPQPSQRRTSIPALKNKASKPNLAPNKPQRKLSKKKRPDTTHSAILRPSLDNNAGLPFPPLAHIPGGRPSTAPQREDRDSLVISYS